MFLWFNQIDKKLDTSFLPKKLLYGSLFKQEAFKNLLSLYSMGLPRTEYLSHLPLTQSVIPNGFLFFMFSFFWQSLVSLGDAAELYNLGQRQMCDDSVTWQWGEGSGGFNDGCVGI